MPNNINFDYFLYINHFYILLKKERTINNNNFFWNNDNNLVEVANESQYEFHESVVHEQYAHWEQYKVKKIKWESIFITEQYIEDYYTESEKEDTLCKMMQKYNRMPHHQGIIFWNS